MKLTEKLNNLFEAKGPKAYFGKKVDGFHWAVKIDGVDNTFPTMPFGRRLDDEKKAREFSSKAKTAYVGAKGKDGMASVKKWIKENNPSQFFAKWKETDSYKDDSVELTYIK